MIVVLSTSSPFVSVALFDDGGDLLASDVEFAPQRASPATFALLQRLRVDPREVGAWVADVGPGSFTGTRVGVTLAKVLAWDQGRDVAGLSSFDLIHPSETVSIPVRKGEWVVREKGLEPFRACEPIGLAYGHGVDRPSYPRADRASSLLKDAVRLAPESLSPLYVVDPNISRPKNPWPALGGPS